MAREMTDTVLRSENEDTEGSETAKIKTPKRKRGLSDMRADGVADPGSKSKLPQPATKTKENATTATERIREQTAAATGTAPITSRGFQPVDKAGEANPREVIGRSSLERTISSRVALAAEPSRPTRGSRRPPSR